MVIYIDSVRYGAGFDETGQWHEAAPAFVPAKKREDDPLNPARGAMYALLVSGALWIGLLAAGRAILSYFGY